MRDDIKIFGAVWLSLVLVAVIFFAIFGAGGHRENSRIYQKCLDSNPTMAYNEVVAKCKEFVK